MEKLYITEPNGKRRLAVKKKCAYCNQDFLVRKVWADTAKYCSRKCMGLAQRKKIKLTCAYCGHSFERPESKLSNSRSGLYFCCREHKDLAQRINGIKQIQPFHYGGGADYRNLAFRYLPNKCNRCGYNANPKILQVHHIDHDRSNNNIGNLEILCPNCHCEEHWG